MDHRRVGDIGWLKTFTSLEEEKGITSLWLCRCGGLHSFFFIFMIWHFHRWATGCGDDRCTEDNTCSSNSKYVYLLLLEEICFLLNTQFSFLLWRLETVSTMAKQLFSCLSKGKTPHRRATDILIWKIRSWVWKYEARCRPVDINEPPWGSQTPCSGLYFWCFLSYSMQLNLLI